MQETEEAKIEKDKNRYLMKLVEPTQNINKSLTNEEKGLLFMKNKFNLQNADFSILKFDFFLSNRRKRSET